MKKTVCILLSVLLAATAFAACNGNSDNSKDKNGITSPEKHTEDQGAKEEEIAEMEEATEESTDKATNGNEVNGENNNEETNEEIVEESSTEETVELSVNYVVENALEVLNSIKSFRQVTESRQEINVMGQCSEVEIFIENETDIKNGISKNHTSINDSETEYYTLETDDGLNLYYNFSGIWSKQEGIDSKVAESNDLNVSTASTELFLERLAGNGTLTEKDNKYVIRGKIEADDEFMDAVGFKNTIANILFSYGIENSDEDVEKIADAISSFDLAIEIEQDTFHITKTSVNMADAYSDLLTVILKMVLGESAEITELDLAIGNCFTETTFSDYNEIGEITIPKEAFDSMDYTFFS